MRVVVLTSSRADYGIYLPLLKKMQEDAFFDLKLIVFGTHLSRFHGYTIESIKKDKFTILSKIDTLPLGDSKAAIANSFGNTISSFSTLWEIHAKKIDILLALGDRFEMCAAVLSTIPFNIKVGHFHGGETTLGAIDNIFRHTITHASKIHFTSTLKYCNRVKQMINSSQQVYNIGSMSLDNLLDHELLEITEFKRLFKIDLSKPSVLITLHPETVDSDKNEDYVLIFIETILNISKIYQIIITMPNADTKGAYIREQFIKNFKNNPNIFLVENFGTLGYFSCIKHSLFLIGNSSSGIIEAASFGKYVINVGNRQKGRAKSKNIIDVPFSKKEILKAIKKIPSNNFTGQNVYFKSNSSSQAIEILKKINFE